MNHLFRRSLYCIDYLSINHVIVTGNFSFNFYTDFRDSLSVKLPNHHLSIGMDIFLVFRVLLFQAVIGAKVYTQTFVFLYSFK